MPHGELGGAPMMRGGVTTRFAPSPTGPLHLGHVASALAAWRTAREAGGRFLLRLEDIDPVRCKPGYADWIEEDLAWLGLEWDGPVRRQSERLAEYAATLAALDARGLLYPCFCTRADIAAAAHAPHGPTGAPVYPGACRSRSRTERGNRIAGGEAYALRLDMAAAARQAGPLTWREVGEGAVACDPEAFGDEVLARKDTPVSYHLCVTHDDAAQGVTHVTRGEDLRAVTSIHRLLQALMGWPAPRYAHHALLTDEAGQRLSKRRGAAAIRDLRARGVAAGEVLLRAGAGQRSPPRRR